MAPKDGHNLVHVRGRLRLYNGGAPNYRMWVVGTHHLLGVVSNEHQFRCLKGNISCDDQDEPDLPSNVQHAFKGPDPFRVILWGDFTLHLLEPVKIGHMQDACIVSAQNLFIGSD